MEALTHASVFALLTLILSFAPLVVAIMYVIRPSERRLALLRPFSLAGLFAALTGGVLGFLTMLRGIALTEEPTIRQAAVGSAESLVPLFVGFGCLTVAWLLVAAGMGRQGRDV